MKFWRILGTLLFVFVACKDNPDSQETDSDTNALAAKYGVKDVYLWNKRVLNKDDGIWRSCWYYKEAPPALGLSERDAMLTSVSLTAMPLHDDHLVQRLGVLIRQKLIEGGVNFVPCAAGVGAVGVSVATTAATGGLAAWSIPLAAAGTLAGCAASADTVTRATKQWSGARAGIVAVRDGSAGLGKKVHASKTELDMIREAIMQANALGYQAKGECQKPSEFKDEIMSRGMGDLEK